MEYFIGSYSLGNTDDFLSFGVLFDHKLHFNLDIEKGLGEGIRNDLRFEMTVYELGAACTGIHLSPMATYQSSPG